MKNHMIFHWKCLTFFIFRKFFENFPKHFSVAKNNMFFGSWKKFTVQLRCRNVLAFDWWCFQSDPDTSSYFLEAVSKKTKFFFTEPQNLVSFGNVLRGTALKQLIHRGACGPQSGRLQDRFCGVTIGCGCSCCLSGVHGVCRWRVAWPVLACRESDWRRSSAADPQRCMRPSKW